MVVAVSSCTKQYTCSIGTATTPEGTPIKKRFISEKAKDNWIKDNTKNGQIAECH